jgi:putative oxidoreductase
MVPALLSQPLNAADPSAAHHLDSLHHQIERAGEGSPGRGCSTEGEDEAEERLCGHVNGTKLFLTNLDRQHGGPRSRTMTKYFYPIHNGIERPLTVDVRMPLSFIKQFLSAMLRVVLSKPFLFDFGLLVLRVFTGTLLIHHGYEKLANIENFADAFVRPLHLPFPIVLSYIAAFSEIVGSWLLILGLFTRFGALAILGTISVAIYHAIAINGFNIYLLELLGLYFGAAAAVLTAGPGRFALDELILRRFAPDLEAQQSRLEASLVASAGIDSDLSGVA